MVQIQINDNSKAAKELLNYLKVLPFVKIEDKSPYNPKFVKKIKDSMKRGNFKEVTASNLWESIG